MNLPVYNEVKIDFSTQECIASDIKNSKIGNAPCYLDLSDMEIDEVNSSLAAIKQELLILGLNPKIPYAFYIVTDKIKQHPFFTIVKTEKELPSYFRIRIKQPSAKESALNQKVQILSEKIKNHLDEEKNDNIKKYANYSKEIYQAKKQEFFWDKLEGLLA